MANETIRLSDYVYYEKQSGFSGSGCVVGHYSGGWANGAIRFPNITINKNQSVSMAWLYYQYYSVGDAGNWKWKLYGIDEDNTAPFGNPFGRSKTSAYNQVDEGAPTSGGAKVIECSSIVNEITSRGGWSSGNAMGFILDDEGSANNVHAVYDYSLGFFAYRVAAEPNFKPTPISIGAPSFPAAQDEGTKIAKPGQSVLTATEEQLYFTTRKYQFKVVTEALYTSAGSEDKTIAHNLGYIPFVSVYSKSVPWDDNWVKLPDPQKYEDHPWYFVDDTNLYLHSPSAYNFYYYIFLDELAA